MIALEDGIPESGPGCCLDFQCSFGSPPGARPGQCPQVIEPFDLKPRIVLINGCHDFRAHIGLRVEAELVDRRQSTCKLWGFAGDISAQEKTEKSRYETVQDEGRDTPAPEETCLAAFEVGLGLLAKCASLGW
ncbi:hypothetical protein [Shimia abyssi]|uniref:Uncharacterized protein n=1 Tax=Shimia abyssi TaxID=1662395 RepID=A0A2P8EYJ1_9RHOB|nr:hypothetical protein [Shimia abyssi]PSL14549.1 hypothetical protein CLV88_12826 [Shimia abyssi]